MYHCISIACCAGHRSVSPHTHTVDELHDLTLHTNEPLIIPTLPLSLSLHITSHYSPHCFLNTTHVSDIPKACVVGIDIKCGVQD